MPNGVSWTSLRMRFVRCSRSGALRPPDPLTVFAEDFPMLHSRLPLRAAFGLFLCGTSLSTVLGCAQHVSSSDTHGGHVAEAPAARTPAVSPSDSALPAGATDVAQRLASSPRHGEYVVIPTG